MGKSIRKIAVFLAVIINLILVLWLFPNISIARDGMIADGRVDVEALNVGDTVQLRHNDDYTMDKNSNLFCVNIARNWASDTKLIKFKVVYKIQIRNNTATVVGGKNDGKSWTARRNGQLAYILTSNGTMGGWDDHNIAQSQAFGSKRQALWLMIDKWFEKANETVKGISNLGGGNEYDDNFFLTADGTHGNTDRTKAGTELKDEAWDYSANIPAVKGTAEDQYAAKRVIGIGSQTLNGVQYDKFGPFNYDVSGSIDSLEIKTPEKTLKSGDGNFRLYQGNAAVSLGNLKNKKDFYILIRKGEVSGITGITINYSVKYDIGCTVIFLQDKDATASQNLLAYKKDNDSKNFSKTFNYEDPTGALKIVKKGTKGGGQLLPGVSFRVTGPNGYDKTVETGSDGTVTISNLQVGTYKIQETGMKYTEPGQTNYGYVVDNHKVQSVEVQSGKTAEVGITNTFHGGGSIQIQKIDEASKKGMQGVVFTLKMTSGVKNGQYVGRDSNGKATYSTSQILLTTDAGGNIPKISDMWEGNFVLTEITNPYPGYDQNLPKDIKTGTIGAEQAVTVTATNKKQYINIEGTVWIDKSAPDKPGTYNHVLDGYDNTHTEGIKVTLIKNDGTSVSTTTNSEGKYYFNNVLIDDIVNNRYHIEYTYNGIKYESVPANTNSSEGKPSRASDIASSRNTLNTNFSTISSSNSTGANAIRYSRNNQNYTSTVIYDENQGNKNAGREADYIPQTTQSRYNVTATTAGIYNLSSGYDQNNLNQTTIEVNFGIIERIQPDLAVTKDVQTVKVSVKSEEYSQLYTYGERVHSDDMTVKFSDNLSYSRNLYASDIAYGDSDYGDVTGQTGKQLEVKVVYKIGLKNKTSLQATIDRLNDFYSSDYNASDIVIGQINETTGEFTETYTNSFTSVSNSGVQGYNKIQINRQFTINGNTTQYFYVQLTVSRSALKDLLNNGNVKEMKNFIEIEQYTTRDANGNLYAGIDKNSQPGNMVPDQPATYEDDNDKAPGLTIGLKAEREVQGNVFLDNTNEATLQGQERQGNGIYDTGENLVNVEKVELVEVDNGGNIVAEPTQIYNGETFVRAEFTENTSSYDISGFVPGRYILRYTWGNGDTTYYELNGEKIEISSQKYKGTIFNQSAHTGEDWYTKDVDTRYSDATDDYARRQEIDAQTSTMTNKTVIDSSNADNSITSQTPTMNMNIEYGAVATISYGQEKQIYVIENGKVKYDENGQAEIKEGQEVYTAKNVDFGIVERPRQELKLDKYIQHVTIYGTDGNMLVDAERNAEGRLENTNHFSYIPAGPGTEAQGKAEMDKELMQNATIIITYNFKITNIGEIDYSTEAYYKYGTDGNNSQIVRLKPNQIIDYIDNNIEAYSNSNTNWKFYETNSEKEKLLNSSDIAGSLGLIQTMEQLERRNKVAVISNIMADSNPGLAPGEELTQDQSGNPISLTSSKLLSANEEGVETMNGAEIIEVERSGQGAILYESTPGNYDIEHYTPTEPDSAYSERIIVIPATGEDRNFTLYVIIGVGVLAIIATAVIFIKKKVLG